MVYEEKTLTVERKYTGTIINVDLLTVELPNGQIATRDIVRHKGASAVIPVTADNEIILVRQYRKPNEMVSIEIPAGKLDDGEDPCDCAVRELEEETGYKANHIEKLFSMHSTPGFSDEILHIYIARDLIPGDANPDEDEFISSFSVSMDEAVAMIKRGQITDGKTISAILAAKVFFSRKNEKQPY
jgi:ADP-ribose pyrophosphatase